MISTFLLLFFLLHNYYYIISNDFFKNGLISDYIQFFTALGTFLAAIATFLTVNEMKKQRIFSYSPRLVIPSQKFHFLFDKSVCEIHWDDKPLNFPDPEKIKEYPNINCERTPNDVDFFIKIYNIGQDIATIKDISWFFDPVTINKFIEYHQNYQDFYIIIKNKNRTHHINQIINHNEKNITKNIYFTLGPQKSNNTFFEIPIPYDMYLLWPFLFLVLLDYNDNIEENAKEQLISYFPIYISISYLDLLNKEKTKNFKLNMNGVKAMRFNENIRFEVIGMLYFVEVE